MAVKKKAVGCRLNVIGRSALCAFLSIAPACSTLAATPELAYLAVTDGYWEVWVADAEGAHARQVTTSKSDKTRLSWFPDGTSLLASCNDGTVVKVGLDGRESRISLAQFPVVDAVVSPEGKRIAFSFSTAIDGNDLWMANSDGSGAEKLIKRATLQHEPVWSPDGKQLYFLSGDGGQAHDIWRLNLATRSTEQLTAGNLYHFDVAVSSTGDMAFSSNRSGNYEIYLQRPGSEPEALTHDPALDGRPAFSPDGAQIVFESTRGGVPNLWRLGLKTRALSQVTHHREGVRAPAWFQGASR